jgi:hypothetical protein
MTLGRLLIQMVSNDDGNGDCRNSHPSIALSVSRTIRDFDRLLSLECHTFCMFTRRKHYSIHCMARNLEFDASASGSKSLPRRDANGIGNDCDDDCLYRRSIVKRILNICPGVILD